MRELLNCSKTHLTKRKLKIINKAIIKCSVVNVSFNRIEVTFGDTPEEYQAKEYEDEEAEEDEAEAEEKEEDEEDSQSESAEEREHAFTVELKSKTVFLLPF